jgi:TatD DNase family protein
MLYDTHAHLNGPAFAEDLAAAIQRAHAAGVTTISAIGYDLASSQRVVEIAHAHGGVYASVGIQPNDVRDAGPGDWDQIVALASDLRVVALGETGLDRYWDHSPFEQQQDYFDRHLRLSQSTGLPVVIHMRECEAEVIAMLREARTRGPVAGVMHSFTGTLEGALECLDLGLFISFAGMVTFKKNNELRDIARSVPLDRLLVETDSPYLSPEPMRKMKRNEPANVAHTARCLAEDRGVSFADFCKQTTANAFKLFKK